MSPILLGGTQSIWAKLKSLCQSPKDNIENPQTVINLVNNVRNTRLCIQMLIQDVKQTLSEFNNFARVFSA